VGPEFQRTAVQLWSQHIRAVTYAGGSRDVVADLALDTLHGRITHILTFGRGLPAHDTDRGVATHAEIVDLAVTELAHEVQRRAIHGICPGVRMHRPLPLGVNLHVTA